MFTHVHVLLRLWCGYSFGGEGAEKWDRGKVHTGCSWGFCAHACAKNNTAVHKGLDAKEQEESNPSRTSDLLLDLSVRV